MTLYELVVLDSTDPTYNPIWRQGGFVSPFGYRLGLSSAGSYWKEDTVAIAHIPLAGLLLISSIWHWLYWDLDLFINSNIINIDLFRVFSIHLTLSSLLCASYGLYHISGLFGPGIFSSDAYGILGTQRAIKPIYSIGALTTYSYGSISSHHISAGILGIGSSIWPLISRQALLSINSSVCIILNLSYLVLYQQYSSQLSYQHQLCGMDLQQPF